MNFQQLEYIVAIEATRHFGQAAERCFVTQPTLSMMVQKLEEELGVKIFDRSKLPVAPTEIGVEIINQARVVLHELSIFKDTVRQSKSEVVGELRLGIIPTLAPYLLPLFLPAFLQKYPGVHLKVSELTTSRIVEKLKVNALHAGLLVTPLNEPGIFEAPLFFEEFAGYVSRSEAIFEKTYLLPEDLDLRHLWLLEDGHCLRTQVLNLCELRKKQPPDWNFEYEAGSIATLKKMVELNNGITILPELAIKDLHPDEWELVRFFAPPAPVREVSIVTHRHFVKQQLLEALKETILASIPENMMNRGGRQRVEIRK